MTLAIGESRFEVGHDRQHFDHTQLHFALVLSSAGAAKILTHHPIVQQAGAAPRLGAGQPVDRTLAAQLLEEIRDAGVNSAHWLPPGLLYSSDSTFAWHVPCKVRPMYFRAGESRVALRVPWPSLIFIARQDGSLHLFAYKGLQRPGRTTRLYHAPLANVFAEGGLCWGSVAAPKFDIASIDAFERAVFRTYFTHPNHERVLSPGIAGKGGRDARLLRFWRSLDRGATEFPERALAPCRKKTLGDICAA